MTLIHYATSGGHRDATAPCGINGFLWDLETDPPGTIGADHGDKERVYFCKGGREDLVTCPGCKPEAGAAIARRKQYEADVEAAGGFDAYNAALMQELHKKLAERRTSK